MESALSDHRREDAWEALSEAFNDNAVDYRFIADEVDGIPPRQLQEILFNEVAPECAFNVLAVIPPVWTGFDRTSPAECIRHTQVRNRRSLLARLRHRIRVAFYRVRFCSHWERIEAELGACRRR